MTDSDTELFDIVCDVLRTDLKLGAVEQMQSHRRRRADGVATGFKDAASDGRCSQPRASSQA